MANLADTYYTHKQYASDRKSATPPPKGICNPTDPLHHCGGAGRHAARTATAVARACTHSAPSVPGHHTHTAEGPAFPGARLSLKRTCRSLTCRRRTSNRDAFRTLASHTHCHCGGACLMWAAGVSHCGGPHHAVSLGTTQSTPQHAVALPRPTEGENAAARPHGALE